MTTKTRKKYLREFKQEAEKLVTEQGYTIGEASRNLGINASLLRRWRQEYQAQASGEALNQYELEELSR